MKNAAKSTPTKKPQGTPTKSTKNAPVKGAAKCTSVKTKKQGTTPVINRTAEKLLDVVEPYVSITIWELVKDHLLDEYKEELRKFRMDDFATDEDALAGIHALVFGSVIDNYSDVLQDWVIEKTEGEIRKIMKPVWKKLYC